MRKLLLVLLLIALIVAGGTIVINGIDTEKFSINSYQKIVEANDQLDSLIKEANTQKDTNYKTAKNSLDSAYKKLVSERASYEELLNLGVDRNGIPLSKIQEYDIEKIWISLGTYADKEGVDLKIDITVNNSVTKTYDLNFTLNGTYSGIEDFIRDVQGDNTLVFKIENFKMISAGTGSQDVLTATFVCKDIKLNIIESSTTNNTQGNTTTLTTEKTGSTSTTGSSK